MPPGPASRAVAGLLVALALTSAALAWHREQHEVALDAYDRYTLPGYDARVYMAMAEAPSVFAVAPWGYRVAWPWFVHLVAPRPGPGTFLALTLLLLLSAGGLLHVWLRQLGCGWLSALSGVLAYGLSPPVSVAVRDPFLVDPLALVLLLAVLLALETAAPLGVVAALLVLGALTKEILLAFLLPTVFLVLYAREGPRRALRGLLVAGTPALCMGLLLPRWWTPHLAPQDAGALSVDVFWLALYRVLAGLSDWGPAALLLGITPLALVGATRSAARPYLRRYGWLLASTWALPFAASVYTDDARNVPFFAADIPRLLLHALPVTLPLALGALRSAAASQGPWPACLSTPAPARRARRLGVLGWAVTCVLLVIPWLTLDRYRRVDLRGRRDGALLLAVSRESLAQARRLASGRPVAFTLAERRFRPERDEAHYLERMRWFLRDGWGVAPQYSSGALLMQSSPATLLLPCLRRDDWTLVLALRAGSAVMLRVLLERAELGRIVIGPQLERFRLHVPAESLARGDNVLAFEVLPAQPPESALNSRIELIEVRVQPRTVADAKP